jgi:hypothetical protein
MDAIDGDDDFVMLKVDTSLNQSMGLVEKGSVLHLTVCVPIYFRYTDLNDLNVVLLVSNFRKMGHMEVDDSKLAAAEKARKRQMGIININGSYERRVMMRTERCKMLCSRVLPLFDLITSTKLCSRWYNLTHVEPAIESVQKNCSRVP